MQVETQLQVETQDLASLPHTPNTFGPQSRNLASVIRGFKAGATTRVRRIEPDFSWQPRYYDVIIRNDRQLGKLRNYIVGNPYDWQGDDHFE